VASGRAAHRNEAPRFFAYVWITSDAERDRNSKSKFPKIENRKIAKSKSENLQKFKARKSYKISRLSVILDRLQNGETPSLKFAPPARKEIKQTMRHGLYSSSDLVVLLNKEI